MSDIAAALTPLWTALEALPFARAIADAHEIYAREAAGKT